MHTLSELLYLLSLKQCELNLFFDEVFDCFYERIFVDDELMDMLGLFLWKTV